MIYITPRWTILNIGNNFSIAQVRFHLIGLLSWVCHHGCIQCTPIHWRVGSSGCEIILGRLCYLKLAELAEKQSVCNAIYSTWNRKFDAGPRWHWNFVTILNSRKLYIWLNCCWWAPYCSTKWFLNGGDNIPRWIKIFLYSMVISITHMMWGIFNCVLALIHVLYITQVLSVKFCSQVSILYTFNRRSLP